MNTFEIELIHQLRKISNKFFDSIFEFITLLGEQYALIIIIAFVIFVINKEKGQRIAYTILMSMCLNGVFKNFVKRTRPFKVDPTLNSVRIETATGFSFPSGHTQNASTAYFSLSKEFKKKYVLIIAIVLVSLIALSRVWLGVHYPSDVIVGAILGILSVIISFYLHQKFENNQITKKKLYLFSLLFFCLFGVLFILINNLFALPYKIEEGKSIKDFRDFYLAIAMFGGFFLASFLEKKYVDFNCNVSLKIRIIRFVLGVVFLLGTYLLTNILFKTLLTSLSLENTIVMALFDCIRYFLVAFVGLFIYPLLFRKTLFK